MERASFPGCWGARPATLPVSSDPRTSARSSIGTIWCFCIPDVGGPVLTDGDWTSDGSLPLWHVTLTVSGDPFDIEALRHGLDRLVEERPFMLSVRYDAFRAELRYWDEAEDVDDAAAL